MSETPPLPPRPEDATGTAPDFTPSLLDLLVEQKARWERGERLPAEEYLARLPTLVEGEEAALDLIGNEVLLRQEGGERVELDEYLRRFPRLAAGLRDLFAAEGLFGAPILRDFFAAEGVLGPLAPAGAPPAVAGYEVLGTLGRGGMGVVYKARHKKLGRVVALKMIQPSLAGGGRWEAVLARFRVEAEAVARLQHPNIVQIFELGEHEGLPFMALEYVEGGNLAGLLARGPLPRHHAGGLLEALARAVHAAHDADVLHRDLKPGNVLLMADGSPKVTDFGLAKMLDDDSGQTRTGAVMGTPAYMAPEQAEGKKEVGPQADVYALGAILYECLTGRMPFVGESVAATLRLVKEADPLPPRRLNPAVPRDLETICLKCLEKLPGQRYASARALAEDLRRFLVGEPIQARPAGPVGRAWRWCLRHPTQTALTAALALVVVGAVAALFLWQRAEMHRRQGALEAELERREEARRREDGLRAAAEGQAALALAELRAGRFGGAADILRQALDALPEEEGQADVRGQVSGQLDIAGRLADFTRLAERAERLAFRENDGRALEACVGGLRRLKVFDGEGPWWGRVPVEGLTAEQRETLLGEVNHQLLLLAILRVKEGLEGGAESHRAALEAVEMVQESHKARGLPRPLAVQILQAFCRLRLGQLSRLEGIDGGEPTGASDCYYLGIASFWLGKLPDDRISKKMRQGMELLGLSLGEPGVAERLLRRAAAEEPARYWAHYWLGWVLVFTGDPRGAELAFTTCVMLRPESGLAYAERARAVAFQAKETKGALAHEELLRRCREDHARAVRAAPHDWLIYVPLWEAYVKLGRQKEWLAAAGRLIELLPTWQDAGLQARLEQGQLLREVLVELAKVDRAGPDGAEAWSLAALARLYLGEEAEALRAAGEALKAAPTHPRALAVRGAISLRRKDGPRAMSDFTAALAKEPTSFLAAAGKARAHELAGEWGPAQGVYTGLLKAAVTDWQRVEAHLGSARALGHLGRGEDARRAIEKVREIDPRAVPVARTP